MIGWISGPCGRPVEDAQAPELAEGSPVAYVTKTIPSVDDTQDIIETLEGRFEDIAGGVNACLSCDKPMVGAG